MVSIAAFTFDPDGAHRFHSLSDGDVSGARRVSRTATLDGGTAVYDTGYTDSDREVAAVINNPGERDVAFARHITSMHDACSVSCIDGVYRAVPASFEVRDGQLRLRLLILEKLD